ncbi:hypothetical protein [Paraburkholderia caffeinilytica]|uniref:hypothetical protein n=1 Tax=Paraburkholderia caffeinilytica TaxID=1761016 RepID=UPI003DA18E17
MTKVKSRHPEAARKPAGIRMREAIREECERQCASLAHKEAADAQIALLGSILGELLSQAAFIVVLNAAGFTAIPCLVRQRLQPRFPENCTVPANRGTDSDNAHCTQGTPIGAPEDASAILAGQTLPVRTIRALDRMAPLRRAAVANLMGTLDNVTGDFAHALLAATPAGLRVVARRSQRVDRRRVQRFARLEKRLLAAHVKNQLLSAGHNDNLRYLAVCISFIRGWTSSDGILVWLRLRYPIQTASLERMVKEADCATEWKRAMKLPYARDRVAGPAKEVRRRARARGAESGQYQRL